MKSKQISTIITLAVVLTSLSQPASAHAFWPFDLFKGDVQGTTTGLIQKMTTRLGAKASPTGMATDKISGMEDRPTFKYRLENAVKNGRLTQTQANEALAKMDAISTKRQELITLEKSFKDWLKTNSLDNSDMAKPSEYKPSRTGTMRPQTTKMPRPSMSPRPTRQ
jgi:hypothetical protein